MIAPRDELDLILAVIVAVVAVTMIYKQLH